MKKIIVSLSMFLFLSGSIVFAGQVQVPTFDDNVRSITTICQDYYNRNEDCPFDEIVGVPKAESRTNRFDTQDLMTEDKAIEDDIKKEVQKEEASQGLIFRSN